MNNDPSIRNNAKTKVGVPRAYKTVKPGDVHGQLSNSVNFKENHSKESNQGDIEGIGRRLNTSYIQARTKTYQRKEVRQESPHFSNPSIKRNSNQSKSVQKNGASRESNFKYRFKGDLQVRKDFRFKNGELALAKNTNVTHNNIITANKVIINYSGTKTAPSTEYPMADAQ